MKRAVEFNTDFTIPKKTRSDAEPDLYTQVISDDQYGDYEPCRYGIVNRVQSKELQSSKDFSHGSNSKNTSFDELKNQPFKLVANSNYQSPLPLCNLEQTVQYVADNYYPPKSTAYNPLPVLPLLKEVPKLGNTYQSIPTRTSDPSLPKVLTAQFQPLFCKLCNLQLSSNSMAKLHYESKKHNRKVRQFLIDYSEETGEPLHPKAVQLPSKTLQDKDPKYYRCNVCDLPLTGRLHAESHYMGKNHRRALGGNNPAGRGHFDPMGKWIREVPVKGPESLDRDNFGLDFVAPVAIAPAPFILPITNELKVENLRCELCEVAVTSQEQMMLHMNGQKHRKRISQITGIPNINVPVGPGVVPCMPEDYCTIADLSSYRTPSGGYYCEPCNTTVNSEIPFRQHMGSKKHAKKVLSNRGPRHNSDSQPLAVKPVVAKPIEKPIITCDICNVTVSSDMQLSIHVNGQKHKKICYEKGLTDQKIGDTSNGADNSQYFKYRTPSGLYYCKRCDLTLSTELQFKAHITGKKHWARITPLTANVATK